MDTCCHEFMPLNKLYLAKKLRLFSFFMCFNLEERLFHILVRWSIIFFSEVSNVKK